ncbi:MAG: RNA polymerase sigma-70 factor (ECF subfamily) [Polyangiales bacterium]|jgi:RNA polymerase sigma-70 factor (ECF subfamily)
MMVSIEQHSVYEEPTPASALSFDEVYTEHFDFVWRSVRRLGIHPPATDDVVQDTFIIAYRKLSSFEGRSTLRSWLFGIARRVVSDHHRSKRRRPEAELSECGTLRTETADGPHAMTAAREAAAVLQHFLETLPDEQREVFVAVEIEQMSAPEFESASGVKLNTVYSRLRLARAAFEKAASQHRQLHESSGR